MYVLAHTGQRKVRGNVGPLRIEIFVKDSSMVSLGTDCGHVVSQYSAKFG